MSREDFFHRQPDISDNLEKWSEVMLAYHNYLWGENVKITEMYKWVGLRLNRVYGYVESQERKEYKARHPTASGRSGTLVQLCAEVRIWRKVYSSLILDFVHNPFYEPERGEVCTEEKFNRLCEAYHDRTSHHWLTHRIIYDNMMGKEEWDDEISRFLENCTKAKARVTKGEIVSNVPRLQECWNQTVDRLYDEISA